MLEAGDQFAVGGDQRLLGFDLRDDGPLRGEGRERDGDALDDALIDFGHASGRAYCIPS